RVLSLIDLLPDRILVREIRLRQRLVDDRDNVASIGCEDIGLVEQPAPENRNSHRLEVVTADRPHIGVQRGLGWIVLTTADLEWAAVGRATERELADYADRPHARCRAEASKQLVVED